MLSSDCFLNGQTEFYIQLVDPLVVMTADYLEDGSLALYLRNALPDNVFQKLTFHFTGKHGILTLTPRDTLIRRLVQVSP